MDLAVDYVNAFGFFKGFRVDRSTSVETAIYTLEDAIASIDTQDPMRAWQGGQKGDRFGRGIFYSKQQSDKYVPGYVATVCIWVKDSTMI